MFQKDELLIFKSPMYRKPKKVTFVEWCEDGVNCHVIFERLNGEDNVLSLVHSQFLSRP